MKNFRATFTTAAFSTLLVLGLQHSDFGQPNLDLTTANTAAQTNSREPFAIRVANYDETVQWYRENLNATIEGEWQVPQNPDARIAYLNVYGFRIKVLSNAKLPANDLQTTDYSQYQIETTSLNRAISLPVNDLSAVIDRLEQKGVNTYRDRQVAFVEDNNGNAVEFVQLI